MGSGSYHRQENGRSGNCHFGCDRCWRPESQLLCSAKSKLSQRCLMFPRPIDVSVPAAIESADLRSDAGAVLSQSDALVGIPITVNHNGLEQAIRHLDSKQTIVTKESFKEALASTATGTAQIVGRVVSAGPGTSVVFNVKDNFQGLQELVRTGIFNGRRAFWLCWVAKPPSDPPFSVQDSASRTCLPMGRSSQLS